MKLKKTLALLLSLTMIAMGTLVLSACGKTLESVEITSAPAKTVYTVGEKFDPTGMKVSAVYSDASKEEVTDFTYAPSGALTAEDTVITVTYGEKTVTQAITVTRVMESIAVTKAPAKVEYKETETFDAAGMEVTATYKDGFTEVITDYTVKPARPLCVNDWNVVVSYGDFSVTQEITVAAAENKRKAMPAYKTVGAVNVGGTEANIDFVFYDDYTVKGTVDSGDAMVNMALAGKFSFPGTWERNDKEFYMVLNTFTFDPKTFESMSGLIPADQPEIKDMFDQLVAMDPFEIEGGTAAVSREADGTVSYTVKINVFGMPIEINGKGQGAPDSIALKAGEHAEAEWGDYSKLLSTSTAAIISANAKQSNGYFLTNICREGNVWQMKVNSATAVKDAQMAFNLRTSLKKDNDISEWLTLKVNGKEATFTGALTESAYKDFIGTADLAAGENVIELIFKTFPVDANNNPVKLSIFYFDYVTFSSDVTVLNPSLGVNK